MANEAEARGGQATTTGESGMAADANYQFSGLNQDNPWGPNVLVLSPDGSNTVVEGGNKQFLIKYDASLADQGAGMGGNTVTVTGGNNQFVVEYDYSSIQNGSGLGNNAVKVEGGNNAFVVNFKYASADGGASGNNASVDGGNNSYVVAQGQGSSGGSPSGNGGNSDYAPFVAAGIPATGLLSYRDDNYHTAQDDIENVSITSLTHSARAVANLVGVASTPPAASRERVGESESEFSRGQTLKLVAMYLELEPRGVAQFTPEDLAPDQFGLQRSSLRVDAEKAPAIGSNPGLLGKGGLLRGMEFVVSDDIAVDPDQLIDAGVRAGLTYREKLTRETSVAVSDAVERGAQLRGKAMHAHRKNIPVVSGEEFARLVGEMEPAE